MVKGIALYFGEDAIGDLEIEFRERSIYRRIELYFIPIDRVGPLPSIVVGPRVGRSYHDGRTLYALILAGRIRIVHLGIVAFRVRTGG